MEPLDDRPRAFSARRTSRPVGVPRRFGVGTALVITAMYAGLFSLLTVLGASPEVFGIIAIFCTGIGLSQMVLFHGKRPRLASWLSGTILLPAIMIGCVLIESSGKGVRAPDVIFVHVFETAVFGGLVGYVAGCLIASVFLVKPRHRDEHGEDETENGDPFA